MSIGERLKKWCRGRPVPPRGSDPGSPVVFLELDRYERPPLAKLLATVLGFSRDHWQWIIGTALAIIGILATR